MAAVTAETFWSLYKQELQDNGLWSAYQGSSSWTPIAISAAQATCQKLGLKTAREYFKVDVIGWEGTGEKDWDLRVAFEAENNLCWEEELCKLAHLVSDLRILVAYQSNMRRPAEQTLDECLVRHKQRVMRDANCRWLFIFGPHPKNRNGCWAAYSLDQSGCRLPINDPAPLLGSHMKD